MTTEKLAKITKAGLVMERGIMSFAIWVDYEDGSSQCVGGYALDAYSKIKQTRVGTEYGCEIIRRLLTELGVNDFHEMVDKKVWVIIDSDRDVIGIRSLFVDSGNRSNGVMFKQIGDEYFGCDYDNG